jgi:hypothetical protein
MRTSFSARVALVSALGVAVLLPSVATADVKEECINAAEKAQALRREKKVRGAREQLLLCVRDACPSFVQTDCVKWLGEVDQGMPTVVIRARDTEGHDVVDVKVSVDGQPFLPKLDGTSVSIDPGQHKFKYEFPSGQVVEETVLVAEGEKGRVLSVAPKAGTTPLPPGGGTEPAPSGGPGVGPWILIGVGAASLVGFGIVETVAQLRYSDYQDTCGKTHSCDASKVSSLSAAFGTGIALLGVGVVGVGVGVTWLLLGGKHTEKAPAPTTTALDVKPLPGGGMLTWAGRF